MATVLLFWLALILPGYVAVRLGSPNDLKSGLLGVVGLSLLATLALLSPFSILCYVLHWPVAVFSTASVLIMVAAAAYITQRKWWREIGTLLLAGAGIEMLIVAVDMGLGGRIGAFMGGGDERLHVARIRFLLEHGFSNLSPFTGSDFFPIYHTNLLHALHATCSQLTGVSVLQVWYASLVPAKLLIAAGCYYLGWGVFQQRWVAWTVALSAIAWLAPMDYVVYPNKLAPYWLIPMMVGFAVQAGQHRCPVSVPVKLAVGGLVLGQLHSLYAVFAGIALGPVLLVMFLLRIIRRRGDQLSGAACVVALFAAAPFALVAKGGMAAPPKNAEATQPTKYFHHTDNGAVILKPSLFQHTEGMIRGGLAIAAIACALSGRYRKQAGVLLAVVATVAGVLFIPPLCEAAIKLLGKEWIAARLAGVLKVTLVALTVGGIASRVEPLASKWWSRAIGSIALACVGGLVIGYGRLDDWRVYLERATAPVETRRQTLTELEEFREFLHNNIMPGETVLADPQTSMWLVMLNDCHVVAVGRGGGVKDLTQRKSDVATIVSQSTSQAMRRTLLKKYGISTCVIDTRIISSKSLGWAQSIQRSKPLHFGRYLLLRLQT